VRGGDWRGPAAFVEEKASDWRMEEMWYAGGLRVEIGLHRGEVLRRECLFCNQTTYAHILSETIISYLRPLGSGQRK
jgi:hypothetical protein